MTCMFDCCLLFSVQTVSEHPNVYNSNTQLPTLVALVTLFQRWCWSNQRPGIGSGVRGQGSAEGEGG